MTITTDLPDEREATQFLAIWIANGEIWSATLRYINHKIYEYITDHDSPKFDIQCDCSDDWTADEWVLPFKTDVYYVIP